MSNKNKTIWTPVRMAYGVEYIMAGNCISTVVINEFETIAVILRLPTGVKRIVHDNLDAALDDAELHYNQAVAETQMPYFGDRPLNVDIFGMTDAELAA